jgi:hypothetical protein
MTMFVTKKYNCSTTKLYNSHWQVIAADVVRGGCPSKILDYYCSSKKFGQSFVFYRIVSYLNNENNDVPQNALLHYPFTNI